MDVSPPPYGRSCQPSLWNFATNLGKSQLICDGEMRWLRLWTQSIFISHQCLIYIQGVWQPLYAVDVLPTTLWLLVPTKCLEFCQKSGLLPGNKWWWIVVIEAAQPTHIHLKSMSYVYKVFDYLYMLWMCIWMCPHHVMAARANQTFGILSEIWATPRQ